MTASNIWNKLTTSQPMFLIYQNINCPERFPEFRTVEAKSEAKVAVVEQVNVIAAVSASTIYREGSTQVITIIGKA